MVDNEIIPVLYPYISGGVHSFPGNSHAVTEYRKLIDSICSENNHYLVMDRAHKHDEFCSLAKSNSFCVVNTTKKVV